MSRPGCVMEHVKSMREDLIRLAGALNEVGRYNDAANVQAGIVVLNDLADLSEFEDIEWPPHVYVQGDGTKDLLYAEEEPEAGEIPFVARALVPVRTPELLSEPPGRYMGSRVMADILRERQRQIEQEGFCQEHDRQHDAGELSRAATCYALSASDQLRGEPAPTFEHDFMAVWPWDRDWWKPKSPRRDLVKAGALIVAELDRLNAAGATE
jgi:hypothetical protein